MCVIIYGTNQPISVSQSIQCQLDVVSLWSAARKAVRGRGMPCVGILDNKAPQETSGSFRVGLEKRAVRSSVD